MLPVPNVTHCISWQSQATGLLANTVAANAALAAVGQSAWGAAVQMLTEAPPPFVGLGLVRVGVEVQAFWLSGFFGAYLIWGGGGGVVRTRV